MILEQSGQNAEVLQQEMQDERWSNAKIGLVTLGITSGAILTGGLCTLIVSVAIACGIAGGVLCLASGATLICNHWKQREVKCLYMSESTGISMQSDPSVPESDTSAEFPPYFKVLLKQLKNFFEELQKADEALKSRYSQIEQTRLTQEEDLEIASISLEGLRKREPKAYVATTSKDPEVLAKIQKRSEAIQKHHDCVKAQEAALVQLTASFNKSQHASEELSQERQAIKKTLLQISELLTDSEEEQPTVEDLERFFKEHGFSIGPDGEVQPIAEAVATLAIPVVLGSSSHQALALQTVPLKKAASESESKQKQALDFQTIRQYEQVKEPFKRKLIDSLFEFLEATIKAIPVLGSAELARLMSVRLAIINQLEAILPDVEGCTVQCFDNTITIRLPKEYKSTNGDTKVHLEKTVSLKLVTEPLLKLEVSGVSIQRCKGTGCYPIREITFEQTKQGQPDEAFQYSVLVSMNPIAKMFTRKYIKYTNRAIIKDFLNAIGVELLSSRTPAGDTIATRLFGLQEGEIAAFHKYFLKKLWVYFRFKDEDRAKIVRQMRDEMATWITDSMAKHAKEVSGLAAGDNGSFFEGREKAIRQLICEKTMEKIQKIVKKKKGSPAEQEKFLSDCREQMQQACAKARFDTWLYQLGMYADEKDDGFRYTSKIELRDVWAQKQQHRIWFGFEHPTKKVEWTS